MITSFLIMTLILFIFNLFVALVSIGNQYGSQQEVKPFQFIVLVVVLIFITWNILALVSS